MTLKYQIFNLVSLWNTPNKSPTQSFALFNKYFPIFSFFVKSLIKAFFAFIKEFPLYELIATVK